MAEFDRYADDYHSMLEESLGVLGGAGGYYLQRKVSLVEGVVRKGDIRSILDFGCGLGGTTLILKNAFPNARVVGVDVSLKSVEQAKLNNPEIEFGCLADELFMAPLSGGVDLIYVANVFHHIPLDERAIVMRSIKGLLAPNGKVFFFEHNPYNPLTRRVVSRCRFDRDAVLLTPLESRLLFESVGFKVEQTQYILFFPHLLKFINKIEGCFRRIPLGAQYCVVAAV